MLTIFSRKFSCSSREKLKFQKIRKTVGVTKISSLPSCFEKHNVPVKLFKKYKFAFKADCFLKQIWL